MLRTLPTLVRDAWSSLGHALSASINTYPRRTKSTAQPRSHRKLSPAALTEQSDSLRERLGIVPEEVVAKALGYKDVKNWRKARYRGRVKLATTKIGNSNFHDENDVRRLLARRTQPGRG